MVRQRHPAWIRYGFALVVTGIALTLKLILVPLVTEDAPFLLFFAAVMASATIGGIGPGLLSILLATIANNYFFMEPFGTFSLTRVQLFRMLLFIVEGVFISAICARLQAARQHAEDSATEARDLEKRILEISDAEQRRIGHDLHDGLGQHLTGIALLTTRLKNHLTTSESPSADDASKLSDLAKTAVEWTHDLTRSLSPPVLESEGLPQALKELCANVESIFRIECTVEEAGSVIVIDVATAVHLYRITQEAISNAIRHGQAKVVRIRIESVSNDLTIQIIDDGVGIPANADSGDGMGLRIMRYRARMIGATVDVGHHATGGTIVTCRYANLNQHANV